MTDIRPTADDPAFIRAAIASLARPCDGLRLDPENARKHPKLSIAAIKGSLARFGQYRPIVVQKQGMVVRAGNGTLTAARALGWKTIAAVVMQMDDATAEQFAVMENRAGDLSRWNEEQLATSMHAIVAALGAGDVQALGWSVDDLAALPPPGGWVPDAYEGGTPLADFQREPKPEHLTLEPLTPVQRQRMLTAIGAARRLNDEELRDASDGEVWAWICGTYLEAHHAA